MRNVISLLAALCVCCLSAGAQTTTVTDNLNSTVGVMLNGTVQQIKIAWPSFTSSFGQNVTAGSVIVNPPQTGPATGKFTYLLQPNLGVTPPAPYTFTFTILNNTTGQSGQFSAQVLVPQSAVALPLAGCQVSAIWWVQQIAITGSSGGYVPPPPTPTGNGNAVSLNGVNLSNIVPVDGQSYVFSATDNAFNPTPVPYWKKYPVSYTQLLGFNATTGTITLRPRANFQKVCGVSMYTTSSFIAPGLSHLVATVGDSNSTASAYTPPGIDTIDNGLEDFAVMGSPVGAGTITATFTATGANLSALTAGALDIDVCLASMPAQQIAGTGGTGTGGSNAISLNGVNLASTAPTDGQAYVFSAADNAFEPIPVPYWKKSTITFSQLNGINATTGTITLRPRANRQKVCGASLYTTAGFVAPGLSHLVATVGDSNASQNYYTPPGIDSISIGLQDFTVMGSPIGASTITATFTATGANLSALTAGSLDIDVCLSNLP